MNTFERKCRKNNTLLQTCFHFPIVPYKVRLGYLNKTYPILLLVLNSQSHFNYCQRQIENEIQRIWNRLLFQHQSVSENLIALVWYLTAQIQRYKLVWEEIRVVSKKQERGISFLLWKLVKRARKVAIARGQQSSLDLSISRAYFTENKYIGKVQVHETTRTFI